MGLLNDAITELQLAMNDPERRVGCLHLMRICAHDLGEPEQAIGHFTEALASSDISGETVLALKLDPGTAHSAACDLSTARRVYQEVQEIDPDFADVASRRNGLEKPEEHEPQQGGDVATDEYETFEEFRGDLDEPDAVEPEAATEPTGDAEEEPAWEPFDDVVAEIEAADIADSPSEEPATAAPAESAEPAGETGTTPKRRKKKISFI